MSNYDKYLRFNEDSSFKISDKRGVWVPDKEEGYLRADVESEDGDNLNLKMGDGSLRTMPAAECSPANPGKFDGVADCAELSHLNDATVLHNLRVRYKRDLIHTSSGLFLVVVNPYKWIPIYTEEIIQMYNGKRRIEVHPHVFAIADESYRAMLMNKKNQSMLITGESGAGKTENTKKVLQYLATIAGKGGQGKLEQQILQANPMLEAFGNAKTNKNDNSSRFGKYIRIQFNAGGVISGSLIQVYLLEKSRVVHQGVNERNFHIFYQMMAGCDAEQQKKYHLPTSPKDVNFFVDKKATKCKALDDVEEWGHTVHAMDVVGVTKEEQDNVYSIMAGIIQAGNLEFKSSYGSEGAAVADPAPLDRLCELWKVDRQKFERALIRPRIKAGMEIVEKHLSVEQAQYSRDAMCKAIYERCFLWLVKKLNRVLEAATEASFIGVLDIAGFEIFEINSFEQLCINFTNEKLQQFFNNHMFKLEQEEYAREKIEWKYVDFGVDSQMTIELIEKKPNSVLSFLDEESIFPRATNKSLITKLHTLATKHKKYSKVKFKDFSFGIAHYAGEVQYDITGWIEKNKDPLQDDIAGALKDSPNQWVSNLFQDPDLDPRARIAKMKASRAPAAGRSKGSRTKSRSGSGASFMTVATTYKEQLNDLMATLESTEPHFIRCIIPNLQKRTQYLECQLILEQLRCNGVLEGIRISRKGFPNRLRYPEMLKRYYLLDDNLRRDDPETKEAVKTLMQTLDSKINGCFDEDTQRSKPYYQFGLTKIFFRHGVLAKLEEWREQKLSAMVIAIQAGARGWLGRSAYRKINQQAVAAKIVQRNVVAWDKFRKWMWWELFTKSKPLLDRVDYDQHLKDLQAKAESLEEEVDAITKTRDGLKKDLAETSDALAKVEDELDDTNSRLNKLEAQQKSLDGENADLQSQLEELEGKIDTLRKSKVALEGDYADVADSLNDTQKRLADATAKRKDLEELKRKNEGEIEDSEAQISDAEAAQAKLKKQLAELEAELASTTGDAEGAADRAASLQKKVASAQAELDDLQDEVDTAKRENAKLESTKKDLEARLKELEDDLDSERSTLTSAKAQQSKLQGELDDLQDELAKANKQGEELARDVKKLEGELADAQDRLSEQKDARSAADKKGKALQSQRDDLESQLADLEGDKSKLDSKNKSDASEIEDLQGQVEAAEAQVGKLKKQISAAEDDLARVQSDLDSEERARADLEAKKKKLEGQLRDAEEELEDEKNKGSQLSKAKAKLEKDLKEAEEQLEDAEARKSKLAAEATKINGELADIEADLEDAEKRAGDLQRSKSQTEAALADAKAQLEEEQEDRSRAEKSRKQAEGQLSSIQAEIDDLESKNSDLESQIRKKSAEAASLSSSAASADLSDAKAKYADQAKRLIEELNDARAKFAEQESLTRTYDREVNTLEEVRKVEAKAKDKTEKDDAQLAAEAREAEQKLKEIQREVESAKAKTAGLQRELAAAKAELETLRDVLQLSVKVAGGAIRG